MRYYHATLLDRVPRILREGLVPRREAPIGMPRLKPHIYVFDALESAVLYSLKWHWHFPFRGQERAVLELDCPVSWFEPDPVSPLNPDMDPPGAWRTLRAIPPTCVRSVDVLGEVVRAKA